MIGLSNVNYVQTPVLNIGYGDHGDSSGFPVILLHGFPYDVRSFDGVVPPLVEAGYRVLVPYLRGYGPTSFIDPGAQRMAEQAAIGQDVVDFAEAKFRVPVEAEGAHHQSLEMTHEEVGQVESPRLLFGHLRERRLAGKELVAVGTRQAFDTFFLDDPVDLTTGTTLRVRDVHIVITITIRFDSGPQRSAYFFRMKMQRCVDTG